MFTITLTLDKETKGAVRYKEDGMDPSDPHSYKVGTMYVRKSALSQPYPQRLTVVVQ